MFLLYCMIEDDAPLQCGAVSGVGGAELRDVAKNGVRYFYSPWRAARSADEVKQQALEFHRASQKILENATLIPFRFPTSVANEQELSMLMDAQSGEYAQELVRLRGMVQMKVAIEGSSHANVSTASGSEYLRQKQLANAPMNSAAEEIKRATENIVSESKQLRRGSGTVLFFLLQREQIEKFRAAVASLQNLSAKVSFSGPWPPSEFVNCYPEARPNQPA